MKKTLSTSSERCHNINSNFSSI